MGVAVLVIVGRGVSVGVATIVGAGVASLAGSVDAGTMVEEDVANVVSVGSAVAVGAEVGGAAVGAVSATPVTTSSETGVESTAGAPGLQATKSNNPNSHSVVRFMGLIIARLWLLILTGTLSVGVYLSGFWPAWTAMVPNMNGR